MKVLAIVLLLALVNAQIDLSQPVVAAGDDFQDCINELFDLTVDVPTQDCTAEYRDGDDSYFHIYTIWFNEFNFDDQNCFNFDLHSGTDMGNDEVSIRDKATYDAVSNSVGFEFDYDEAPSLNCHIEEDDDWYIQKCWFQLDVLLNEVIQQEIQWHSNTKWPKNASQTVQVQIVKDLVQGCCPENEFEIEDELIFCTDITCATEKDPLTFVRNQDIFMKYSILSDGFSNQLLELKSLTFDDYDPMIVNDDDINDPTRPVGELTFQLRYPVAAATVEVALVVDIKRDFPDQVGDGADGDQEFNEDGIVDGINDENIGDMQDNADGDGRRRLSNTSMAEVGRDVPMGKMVNIEILEEEGANNNSQKPGAKAPVEESDNTVLIIVLSVLAVLIVGVAIFGIVKYTSNKKASKYKQSENTESELVKA